MLTRRRPLALLLISATAAFATPAAPAGAAAKKAKAASAATILKDCKRDDEITKKYRLSDLKKARTTFNKKKRAYGECGSALGSAIAGLSGKKGKNSTSAVFRECTRSAGLKSRFKASTLKKALGSVPADLRDYSTCSSSIASQLNTVK